MTRTGRTMVGPRQARPDEFAELMDFVDMVFRPGERERFILQQQYPHLYRPEPAYVARNLLVRDNGRIVGNLVVHPLALRLEEVVIPAGGGVGLVSAHPARRGEVFPQGSAGARLDGVLPLPLHIPPLNHV